ncbi:hypothetical protein CCP4SC76_5420001 [Gammaproteobacteria bacterium]
MRLYLRPCPPSEAILTRLAGVPGFNLTRGLAVLPGKTARYLALLGDFVESQTNHMVRLAELLAAGDHTRAHRLAHSLKGAAATLGAERLSESARGLETIFRLYPDAALLDDTTRAKILVDLQAINFELEALRHALSSHSHEASHDRHSR